jgi:hypothetical protein
MRAPSPRNVLAHAIAPITFEVMRRIDQLDEDRPTPQRIEKLATIGCTDDEIADRFLAEPDWIRRTFHEQLRRGRARFHIALRMAQYTLATKDSAAAMLIWLGRNVLGQSNSPTHAGEPEPELEQKTG